MVVAAPLEQNAPVDIQTLADLVTRAKGGAEQDVNAFRSYLDEHPEVWQRVGDLGSRVEMLWVRIASDDRPLEKESLHRQLMMMKAELEGESPSSLERLLVQQVVTSWLQLKHSEMEAGWLTGTEPISVSRFYVQRTESAQRRYLGAIETLTKVRQMLRAMSDRSSEIGKRRKSVEGPDTAHASEV